MSDIPLYEFDITFVLLYLRTNVKYYRYVVYDTIHLCFTYNRTVNPPTVPFSPIVLFTFGSLCEDNIVITWCLRMIPIKIICQSGTKMFTTPLPVLPVGLRLPGEQSLKLLNFIVGISVIVCALISLTIITKRAEKTTDVCKLLIPSLNR